MSCKPLSVFCIHSYDLPNLVFVIEMVFFFISNYILRSVTFLSISDFDLCYSLLSIILKCLSACFEIAGNNFHLLYWHVFLLCFFSPWMLC